MPGLAVILTRQLASRVSESSWLAPDVMDDLLVGLDRRFGLVEFAIQPVRLIEKPEGRPIGLLAKLFDRIGDARQLGLQGFELLFLSLPGQHVLDELEGGLRLGLQLLDLHLQRGQLVLLGRSCWLVGL